MASSQDELRGTQGHRVAQRLGFLGVAVDPADNDGTTEGEITAAGATVRVLVVPAREDLEIARGTRWALAAADEH